MPVSSESAKSRDIMRETPLFSRPPLKFVVHMESDPMMESLMLVYPASL